MAMRSLLVILSVGLLVTLAIVFADLQAPRLTTVGVGSLGFKPEAVGPEPIPPKDGCADAGSSGTDSPCARRFAFAPNGTLKTWVSVRNDGPLSVTLDGLRQAWLDQFAQTTLLARPVVVTDAGDAFRETGGAHGAHGDRLRHLNQAASPRPDRSWPGSSTGPAFDLPFLVG